MSLSALNAGDNSSTPSISTTAVGPEEVAPSVTLSLPNANSSHPTPFTSTQKINADEKAADDTKSLGEKPYSQNPPHHHYPHQHPHALDDKELRRVESRVEMYGGDDVRDPPALRRSLSTKSKASRHSSTASAESEDEDGESSSPSTPDPNLVTWDGPNDPANPQNWSVSYKWFLTLVCAAMTINVTFASSAPTATTHLLMREFNISQEVSDLITSVFLLGYVFGPLFWGPGSELVGRRPIFILTLSLYTIFHLGQALATNTQTLLVTRFLSGFFAVAPLTNCGGVIADIWPAVGRGPATSLFTASVFLGPVMGPIVSGYIVQSDVSWRWVFWVMMMFAGACTILTIVCLPETYAPILLAKKAKKLRKVAQKDGKPSELYAEHERQDWSIGGIVHRTIYRPFQMLALEPILVLVTVYLSLVYGLIYALFQALPIIFVLRRGFTISQVGLIFIGVGIGTSLGAFVNYLFSRDYPRLIAKWRGFPPPEQRLKGAIVGGPCLVIGCFWLGWSGEYASVHWAVPALATVMVGFGVCAVFISFLSYLVDTYLMYSASAFAANTVVRSAVAAAFPLFTTQMFLKLGVNWACTLLGLIALVLAPSPLLFMKYGPRIRSSSRFAPCIDLKIASQIKEEEEKQERERRMRESARGVPMAFTESRTDTMV
ncbi:hypothetical protein AX16_006036 [Volvariella volvacea WC 439]|nr:hypothetical protein AX16_006036 [Volvariella volvacea WC 439]